MSWLLVSLLAGATGVALAWLKAKHSAGSAGIEAACSPEAKKLVQLEDRVSTVVDVASIITNLAGEGAPWVRLDVSVVMSVSVSNKDKIAAVLAQDFMGFMRSLKPEQLVGGRGRAMEVQQPAWGQQVLDQVLPF